MFQDFKNSKMKLIQCTSLRMNCDGCWNQSIDYTMSFEQHLLEMWINELDC